jgi:hypothetical protein
VRISVAHTFEPHTMSHYAVLPPALFDPRLWKLSLNAALAAFSLLERASGVMTFCRDVEFSALGRREIRAYSGQPMRARKVGSCLRHCKALLDNVNRDAAVLNMSMMGQDGRYGETSTTKSGHDLLG